MAPFAVVARAGDSESEHGPSIAFTFHGYGIVNAAAFDWQTDPHRRAQVDLERFALYPSWQLDPDVWVRAEVEFEHGGTGASIEFDRFEEFGEYEIEVEKGGAVELEQLHLEWDWRPALSWKAGRFKLPIGLAGLLDEPTEYFTTSPSEMEAHLIPVNWYETGLQAFGAFGSRRSLRYWLSLVNGLDSTGFSSARWIATGYQQRFETVNAEDLAVTARIDVQPWPDFVVGASAYTGDSANNRPKPDLEISARVFLVDAHAIVERGPLRLRAVALLGTLENADRVSQANRNLSNNLNVKRTPVGSRAAGWSVEAGWDLASLVSALPFRLDLFGRFERYDSMAAVEGDVFDNPRWDRRTATLGLNLHPCNGVVAKAQYSHRTLGTATDNVENTTSMGIGLEF